MNTPLWQEIQNLEQDISKTINAGKPIPQETLAEVEAARKKTTDLEITINHYQILKENETK